MRSFLKRCGADLAAGARSVSTVVFLCLGGVWVAGVAFKNPSYGERSRQQQAARFPLTEFYDTPRPLPPGVPGQLIRAMPFEDYDLPPGIEAVRFLYHSRSADLSDVAASGVVLFPDRETPSAGWPVVVWAHELRGVARACAPSLLRNPEHGPFLTMYVTLGYAVVIPDYTGLGTNFANAAADIPSNAADVIYSVPAARRAVRALGQRWVAMGREEGGLASLGVAERESEDPVDLGSIALSGLAELDDSAAIGRRAYSWPLVLAYGIKRIYPEFHESDILTPQASARLERLAVSCSEDSEKGGASAARLLKPNWAANLFVESYFRRNRLGLRPAARPLLILTSREDPWLVATGRIVHRLCGQGDRVQFELYPESDPGRVIGDSVRDQIAWIQARFSRRPAPTNCSAEH